uniref:DNA primase n=1 Tax=Oryza punctata TaxID=4537 RepID=A0A0E0LJS2_ORYPU
YSHAHPVIHAYISLPHGPTTLSQSPLLSRAPAAAAAAPSPPAPSLPTLPLLRATAKPTGTPPRLQTPRRIPPPISASPPSHLQIGDADAPHADRAAAPPDREPRAKEANILEVNPLLRRRRIPRLAAAPSICRRRRFLQIGRRERGGKHIGGEVRGGGFKGIECWAAAEVRCSPERREPKPTTDTQRPSPPEKKKEK